MSSLIERLIAGGPVITDGAWGTELQARGLACGEFPDDWNLTHPDAVLEVARAYVEAGSRVVLTNTFGAIESGSANMSARARLPRSIVPELRSRELRPEATPLFLPPWAPVERCS